MHFSRFYGTFGFLMRRTWLIISGGGQAGFDAQVPSLALTIDRGFPVRCDRGALFDDLIPLDQKDDIDKRPARSCQGWHGMQARLALSTLTTVTFLLLACFSERARCLSHRNGGPWHAAGSFSLFYFLSLFSTAHHLIDKSGFLGSYLWSARRFRLRPGGLRVQGGYSGGTPDERARDGLVIFRQLRTGAS